MEARDNNLGTLRLVAAFAVLFAHCFVLLEPGHQDPLTETFREVMPLQRGLAGLGVALFFVISGFLVTASFLRRPEMRSYAAARALRIFPALWVALILTIGISMLITTLGPLEFLEQRTTSGYLVHNASLLGMRYELAGVFTDNPLNEVNVSLWTLPLEFLMYLVVALLGAVRVLHNRVAFNVFAVACVAVYFLAGARFPIIHDRHNSELLLYFLAGAAYFVNRDLIAIRGVVALPLLALIMGLSALGATWAHLPIIAGFAYFVLWIGFTDRVRFPNLAARGDLSYATYLYAALVSQLWILWIVDLSPWLLVVLTAGVTLPLAYLSWHFIERPALARKPEVSSPSGRASRDDGQIRTSPRQAPST